MRVSSFASWIDDHLSCHSTEPGAYWALVWVRKNPPEPGLDRLYGRLNVALDRLLAAVGLASSPTTNENKILFNASITAYAFSQTAL
jgi:hypothetical protein